MDAWLTYKQKNKQSTFHFFSTLHLTHAFIVLRTQVRQRSSESDACEFGGKEIPKARSLLCLKTTRSFNQGQQLFKYEADVLHRK